MELVNPVWSQAHMFLTMSTFNDTDEMMTGEVELVKNASMVKNEGTFVAMESFIIFGTFSVRAPTDVPAPRRAARALQL